MGACSSTTELDFDYLYQNNVIFSQKLWKYCSEKKIRFVYASSAATYGLGEHGFLDDNKALYHLKPINAYGYTKHLFDLWAIKQKTQPSHWAGLKFFNVYGPLEKFKYEMASVAHRGILQAHDEGKIKLFKSGKKEYKHGEQRRDFIYIDDVVNIIIHFLNSEIILSSLIFICVNKYASINVTGNSIIHLLGSIP